MVNVADRLALEGCEIAYGDTGNADARTAVVFLHGAGVDHRMFGAQAATVHASGRRVVLMDIRGHGISRPSTLPVTAEVLVSDARRLIVALALERPVLVGHSLGGNVAQALVRRDPNQYAGLTVIDSTWNTGPLRPFERVLLRMAAPILGLIPAASLPGILARASATTRDARTLLTDVFARVPKREFLDIWRATTAFVTLEPGYRTPVPLCLIRGADDGTGNISTAMPAWAAHEGIDETVIPGAGHVATMDAPDAVSSALLQFLDRVETDDDGT